MFLWLRHENETYGTEMNCAKFQCVLRGLIVSCHFVLLKSARVEYMQTDSGQVSFCFGRDGTFPCSGVITATGEGYIYAPALRLAITLGRDIVFLLLSPATMPHEVSVEKA